MKGYLNDEKSTAATIDVDGWLHTGDVGYVDEDGNFFIVDRVKELIKFKGFQVRNCLLPAMRFFIHFLRSFPAAAFSHFC